MKDVLNYKGYIGSVHYAAEDRVFYGKVEGINDLIFTRRQHTMQP